MTLTPFEWVLITAGVTLLIAVIAWLLVDKIKRLERDHEAEVHARMSGDSELRRACAAADQELAETLKGIVKELHSNRLRDAQEHAGFATREDIGKIHARFDDVILMLTELRSDFVSKEDCRERHANLASAVAG